MSRLGAARARLVGSTDVSRPTRHPGLPSPSAEWGSPHTVGATPGRTTPKSRFPMRWTTTIDDVLTGRPTSEFLSPNVQGAGAASLCNLLCAPGASPRRGFLALPSGCFQERRSSKNFVVELLAGVWIPHDVDTPHSIRTHPRRCARLSRRLASDSRPIARFERVDAARRRECDRDVGRDGTR